MARNKLRKSRRADEKANLPLSSETRVCPHCGGVLPEGAGTPAKDLYLLRRRQKLWELVYGGERGYFKHEKGAEYVARLLADEGPLHAMELAHPASGGIGQARLEARLSDIVEIGGRIQERSTALDEKEERRILSEQRRRLQAMAEDESASKGVRENARRDIEAIDRFLRAGVGRPTDGAQKAVRAVRMAIKRFQKSLEMAVDGAGRPERILRGFGEHVRRYLIVPSARYSDPRGREARKGLAGCFVYERPEGVKWRIGF